MKFLVVIVVFFSLSFGLAQKPFVELSVSSDHVGVGESFNVTAKSNIGGNIEIEYPNELKPGFSVLNGMKQEMDYTSGHFVSLFYITKDASFTKKGKFTIGPAYVRKGGKVYKSDVVIVTVDSSPNSKQQQIAPNQSQNNNSIVSTPNQPAYGIIELSKRRLYEGEPLILKASVYARFRPSQLENYRSYQVPDVMDVHDLDKSSQINMDQKRINGEALFTFSLDLKVVFPIKKGEHKVTPFSLDLRSGFGFRGYEFSSNSPTYEVIPLPKNSPNYFKGGVGKFSVSRSVSNKKFKQGDVIALEFELRGSGNLHLISKPEMKLPNSIQIYGDPIVDEKIKFNANGAEGKVIYKYNVQLLDSGKLIIPSFKYAYFDPTQEKYITIDLPAIELNVVGDPSFALMEDLYKQDTIGYELIEDENKEDIIKNQSSSSNWIHWLYLSILGIAISGFILIYKRRKKSELQENSDNTVLNPVSEIITPTQDEPAPKFITSNERSELIYQLGMSFERKEYKQYYELLYKSIQLLIMERFKIDKLNYPSKNELMTQLKGDDSLNSIVEDVEYLMNKSEEAKYSPYHSEEEIELIQEMFNKCYQILIH